MKKSDQLKQEREALVNQMQALNTTIESRTENKGVYSDEENNQFNDLQKQVQEKEAAIERNLILEAQQANRSFSSGTKLDAQDRDFNKIAKRYSLHKALRSQLQGGRLDGVELEMHQEALKQIRSQTNTKVTVEGVLVPNTLRTAKQSVTQDSGEFGGNLVYEEFKGLLEALEPKPVVQSLGANYMRGLRGPASFSTELAGIVATWEGETTTVAPTAQEYGKKTMDAKRLSATVPITVQNIHQSVIDLELQTANAIRRATEKAIDLAAINGDGLGYGPIGILNLTNVNSVVNGTDGGAPTWAKLVEMITLIEDQNAYLNEISYLINPLTKGYLKSTLHTAGDSKYLMSEDNSLNGLNVGVSTFVPKDLIKQNGTNLSAAIAGDFSQVMIGEWGFSDMVVDYVTRKKEGMIEITNNQYLDVLVAYEEAFTVVKDFDLS